MNTKRFGFAALALAALLWTGPGFASSPTPLFSTNEYTIGKGDLETDVYINPDIWRGDIKATNFFLRLGANYFITDIFAPGVEIGVQKIGGTNFQFLPNLKAYWPLNQRFAPYFMVGMGYFHAPGANLFDFAIGPGINYMLSDTVAIGAQFRYDLLTGNGTAHRIQFPLSFHIYFKI